MTSIRDHKSTVDHKFPVDSHRIYKIAVDDVTKIETLVTNRANMVESWIAEIERANRCRLYRLIVGLDVECRPNFTRGTHNPVATLQLCVGKSCLVYQILQSPEIPNRLVKFLEDPNYTFVGVGVKMDAKMLLSDFGLRVANTMELAPLAASELGKVELGRAGLKRLGNEIAGVFMEKPKHITLSRWDKPKLSYSQVSYACLDAYVSFEIGRRLSSWY